MSDAETSVTVEGGQVDDLDSEDQPVEDQSQGPQGTKLRVSGLPFNDSLTVGDITITRDGTDVPADKLEEVQRAAAEADMPLEVVPQ